MKEARRGPGNRRGITPVGEDRLNCMVRDAHWIYCYWELAGDAVERASRGRGPGFLQTVRWALRMSPAEGEPYDVDVGPTDRGRYVRVRPSERCGVELGLLTSGGEFLALVSGGEVTMPPGPFGEIADRDWGPLASELERFVEQGLVGSSANSPTSTSGISTSGT